MLWRKKGFTIRDKVPWVSSGQVQRDGIHLTLFCHLRGRCPNSSQETQALFLVKREEQIVLRCDLPDLFQDGKIPELFQYLSRCLPNLPAHATHFAVSGIWMDIKGKIHCSNKVQVLSVLIPPLLTHLFSWVPFQKLSNKRKVAFNYQLGFNLGLSCFKSYGKRTDWLLIKQQLLEHQ